MDCRAAGDHLSSGRASLAGLCADAGHRLGKTTISFLHYCHKFVYISHYNIRLCETSEKIIQFL